MLVDNLGKDMFLSSEGNIPSNITDYFLYMTETLRVKLLLLRD